MLEFVALMGLCSIMFALLLLSLLVTEWWRDRGKPKGTPYHFKQYYCLACDWRASKVGPQATCMSKCEKCGSHRLSLTTGVSYLKEKN